MNTFGGFKVQSSKFKVIAQNPEPRTQNDFECGQTLIAVLWVIGFLSVALGGITAQSMHELRLTQIPLSVLQSKAIATAALQQAIAVIQRDVPAVDHLTEPWATGLEPDTKQPFFEHIAVGSGMFSIGANDPETGEWHAGLIDEERKLNLNRASVDQLRRLIELVKPDDHDAQAVANALMDWRDEPLGPTCTAATPPCHNGPLDSVDELRLVPGMTSPLFTALEPYVTIYGAGAVNVNTASAIALKALGCDSDALVQQRSDHPFTSPPASCAGTTVQSTTFTAIIDAGMEHSSGATHVQATFDRTGKILAWSSR